MRRPIMLVSCLLAMASGVSAQVYESRDAQGNPTFSDRPSSGAKEIEVPPTNSADAVEPSERPPAQTAVKQAPAQLAAPAAAVERDDDDYIYYGGADNEEAKRRLEERRENAGDGPGREPPRIQPLPARARPGVGGGRR